MRCEWCHNPESQYKAPEIMFLENQCIGCNACLSICEKGAHYHKDGRHVMNPVICRGCDRMLQCENICCTNSIQVCGKKMTDGEVVSSICKDMDFYGKEGGVTFSGGEPLLQADFICKVMEKCSAFGISAAVDTTLNLPWKAVSKTLPFIDWYLVDIKFMNNSLHRIYTGADNEDMLRNLPLLSETGKKIIIRMPILKGINDTEEEFLERKRFLKQLKGVERVDILPVTNHGWNKYGALGRVGNRFHDGIVTEDITLDAKRFWGV